MNFIRRIIDRIRYGKKRDGLVDIRDDKNFGSRALYKPDKEDLLEALKETFVVFNPELVDQLDSDHCVGEGGGYEASATEDFNQGSGSFVFAMAKKWSGRPIAEFGTSLLAGCMARVVYGICRRDLWEYRKGMRNYYSDWRNISNEAIIDAGNHKAGSAWEVDVPWGWSKFDAIVATLYHYREKKVLIGTGNNAHRITVIGYDKKRDSLICADTYGTRTFNNGIRFIDRNEARTLFTAYFVIDIERSLAELLIAHNDKAIKTEDNPDCYLVQNGEKHKLPNEPIAWAFNTLLFEPNNVTVISRADLDKIPTGKPVEFRKGKNWQLVKRFFELDKSKFDEYKKIIDTL